MAAQLCEYTETIELYTLTGWIVWCVHCVSGPPLEQKEVKVWQIRTAGPTQAG